jgi:mRNA interferase RelE/StbE
MTYRLRFLEDAEKEWRKLDANTRSQFQKKLVARLEHPRVPSAQLRGSRNRYKIKLRSVDYRLVYEVRDADIVVLVITVGRRDKDEIYLAAEKR